MNLDCDGTQQAVLVSCFFCCLQQLICPWVNKSHKNDYLVTWPPLYGSLSCKPKSDKLIIFGIDFTNNSDHAFTRDLKLGKNVHYG